MLAHRFANTVSFFERLCVHVFNRKPETSVINSFQVLTINGCKTLIMRYLSRIVVVSLFILVLFLF